MRSAITRQARPHKNKHLEVASLVVHSPIIDIRCLGWYTWPLDCLIHHMKFRRRPMISLLLSQWFMNRALQQPEVLPDAVMAVPATNWRLFTRGYNQAALLSKHIAHSLKIDDVSVLAQRKSMLIAQHKLAREDRISRDLGFKIKALPRTVKRLVLIDDVVTTGATLMSLARAIHCQYPHILIEAWVMAVTPYKR
ncbi:ComF family protein [Alteromonas sediminis]|uniref:ComF family protein n=1 Tax=Alteromonas sediminis TaxID=2259342 RepID=A0A3N5Y0T0_9ALTE|nr:ComF family protein [Alteromonas sediminis]RPJ66503.1 ComF family protein [Alteromonas sediminis]